MTTASAAASDGIVPVGAGVLCRDSAVWIRISGSSVRNAQPDREESRTAMQNNIGIRRMMIPPFDK